MNRLTDLDDLVVADLKPFGNQPFQRLGQMVRRGMSLAVDHSSTFPPSRLLQGDAPNPRRYQFDRKRMAYGPPMVSGFPSDLPNALLVHPVCRPDMFILIRPYHSFSPAASV